MGSGTPSTGGVAMVTMKNNDSGSNVQVEYSPASGKATSSRRRRALVGGALCVLFLCIVAVFLLVYFLVIKPSTEDETPTFLFGSAAVATDDERCSIIGKDVLLDGGSAMDAAIAALLCCGVVHPHSAGLGGGSFIIAYDKSAGGGVRVFNGRETAPAGATEDMFQTADSRVGGLSIGVPGELANLWKAWGRLGRLPWKRLFEPSVAMMNNGVAIGHHLSTSIQASEAKISNDTLLSSLYRNADGSLKREGDIVHYTSLAETYSKLAESEDPHELFYVGEIADVLVGDIAARDGIVQKSDMADYEAKEESATEVPFRGFTVHAPRAPSGGPVVSFILNVLEHYDRLTSVRRDIQRVIETFKFGYGARMGLGDPASVTGVAAFAREILTPGHGRLVRGMISERATNPNVSHYIPAGVEERIGDRGTTHLSVLDAHGNAVAITSSVNYYFGSGVGSVRTGILLNNQMDDFSTPGTDNLYGLPPSKVNYPSARKRMQSSMAPTIATDAAGNVKLVVGASGGSRIPTAVASVALFCLAYDEDVVQAVDRKRFHHQLLPDRVLVEHGTGEPLVELIQSFGHTTKIRDATSRFSIVQVIKRVTGGVQAYSDPRKKGVADGY